MSNREGLLGSEGAADEDGVVGAAVSVKEGGEESVAQWRSAGGQSTPASFLRVQQPRIRSRTAALSEGSGDYVCTSLQCQCACHEDTARA